MQTVDGTQVLAVSGGTFGERGRGVTSQPRARPAAATPGGTPTLPSPFLGAWARKGPGPAPLQARGGGGEGVSHHGKPFFKRTTRGRVETRILTSAGSQPNVSSFAN